MSTIDLSQVVLSKSDIAELLTSNPSLIQNPAAFASALENAKRVKYARSLERSAKADVTRQYRDQQKAKPYGIRAPHKVKKDKNGNVKPNTTCSFDIPGRPFPLSLHARYVPGWVDWIVEHSGEIKAFARTINDTTGETVVTGDKKQA
jgi:hypothetical protein